jgi:hypothetical protein
MRAERTAYVHYYHAHENDKHAKVHDNHAPVHVKCDASIKKPQI